MAINRLRIVQQRDSALIKQQWRDMAKLLETGKEESAKIRVEIIIRRDLDVELLEILELYCELIVARIGLIDAKECSPNLEEAIKTLMYAGPYTEIKELHQLKDVFMHKYGAEFTADATENRSGIVPKKVLSRLKLDPPSSELVAQYLAEIARAYEVPFSGLQDVKKESDSEDLATVPLVHVTDEPTSPKDKVSSESRLSGLAMLPQPNRLDKNAPIKISGPPPSTDNTFPQLKIPQPLDTAAKKDSEVDTLRSRFEALRR